MKSVLLLFALPLICISQTPCLDAVSNATGLIGEFVPQCEEDGSYSPLQCWASTGYCWCVDEDGIEITGTSLGPGEGTPNCYGVNIFEHKHNRKLIKCFDMLGRETSQKKGINFELYDDGTIEKKYHIHSFDLN